MICEMLNYLDSNDVAPLLKMLDEIRRMLSALIKNGRADQRLIENLDGETSDNQTIRRTDNLIIKHTDIR